MVEQQTSVGQDLVGKWARIIQEPNGNLSIASLFDLGTEILQEIHPADWQNVEQTPLPHAGKNIYLGYIQQNEDGPETVWIEIEGDTVFQEYYIQRSDNGDHKVETPITFDNWQEIQLAPEEIANIARQLFEAYKNSPALSRP